MKSTYQQFEESSPENRRMLREEELILHFTETITNALEESGLSRADLAARLGKSRAFVSQALSGGRNLTIRTIADFLDALDQQLLIASVPRSQGTSCMVLREPAQFGWAPEASSTWAIKVLPVHKGSGQGVA